MAGPAKQFDRDQALKQAMALFWGKGFEATSMQDLVEATGVNRASLYDTYGNKRAIYVEALNSYCDGVSMVLEQLLESACPPLECIREFLTHLSSADEYTKNGCFANNTAVELGPHDEQIAKKVKTFWQHIEDVLTRLLDRGVEQGAVKATANTRDLARFVNTCLQGIAVQSKLGMDQNQAEKTIELILKTLSN